MSHNAGSPARIGFGHITNGSRVVVSVGDEVFGGKYNSAGHGAYSTGSVSWAIPWKYSIDSASWNLIRTADQTATSTSTGKCTISKQGSGSHSKELSDPDSEW